MITLQIAAQKLIEAYQKIMSNPDSNGFGGRDLFGHVGAWLWVPSIGWLWYQSQMDPKTGLFTHAERGVIELALARLGTETLPDGCILVVTMEPCTGETGPRRGGCCSDLISSHNIETAFVGYRDWTHRNLDTGDWPGHKFKFTLVEDLDAIEKSRELYRLFDNWYIEQPENAEMLKWRVD